MKIANCKGCNNQFEYQGSYVRKYCTVECMGKHYKQRLQGQANPNFVHGKKTCEACGKTISKNAKQWCRPCRDEKQRGEGNPFYGKSHSATTRMKMSKNHADNSHWIGRPHSVESRSKMSQSQKLRMKRPDQLSKAKATLLAATQQQLNYNPTKPELAVEKILKSAGISFEKNKKMYDKFLVDFYLDGGTIIEVFGDYWHGHPVKFPIPNAMQQSQMKKDKSRLAYLKKCGHQIVVIWETDLPKVDISQLLNA